MGFLAKIFGGESYPELDPQNPAARKLASVKAGLHALGEQTKDRLEVVPAEKKAFVFVGKPPKQFGLVWVEGGEIRNLKHYMEEHHIDKQRAGKLVEALSQAYTKSQSAPRYSTQLDGRQFVVTPSEGLATEVERVLERGATA